VCASEFVVVSAHVCAGVYAVGCASFGVGADAYVSATACLTVSPHVGVHVSDVLSVALRHLHDLGPDFDGLTAQRRGIHDASVVPRHSLPHRTSLPRFTSSTPRVTTTPHVSAQSRRASARATPALGGTRARKPKAEHAGRTTPRSRSGQLVFPRLHRGSMTLKRGSLGP